MMLIIPRRETFAIVTLCLGLWSGFAATPLATGDDGVPYGGQRTLSDKELLEVGQLLGVGNRLYGRQPAASVASRQPSIPRRPDRLVGAETDPLAAFADPSAEADPLAGLGSSEPIKPPAAKTPEKKDPHEGLWTEECYPSAESCRACHPKHYDEWSVSSHAYASVSPMFQRFEQAMTELTEGTVGSFCMRCHSPVATQLEIPRTVSILDQPPVAREGVTCVSCHRINEHYGRSSNGDRRIEPGNIHAPVGRGGNGTGLAAALANAEKNKLKTHPGQKGTGQAIHNGSYFFEPLTKSDICASCHQVAVHPGISLEVVHAQYRS
ncbi:multiheme c-type cytochrome, partial [Rhodopirellula bahusiensis]